MSISTWIGRQKAIVGFTSSAFMLILVGINASVAVRNELIGWGVEAPLYVVGPVMAGLIWGLANWFWRSGIAQAEMAFTWRSNPEWNNRVSHTTCRICGAKSDGLSHE